MQRSAAVSGQVDLYGQEPVAVIKNLIGEGAHVLNLPAGLNHYLTGDWNRSCHQCVVYENVRAGVGPICHTHI